MVTFLESDGRAGVQSVDHYQSSTKTPPVPQQSVREVKECFHLLETARSGFVAKQKLPFLLLSDENSDVCEKYGVWNEKINFGKKYFGIIRSTFLIDEKGEIIKEWRKVKVEGHVDEIIEELDK